MKILLTGANGQLGRCLQDRFPTEWEVIALGSTELNIGHREEVVEKVNQLHPTVMINAAAYTAVDKAESDRDTAAAVNSFGPAYLAAAAKQVGAKFIHISTDYVFEGHGNKPYQETDAVYPLGVYGKTKLAGELLVQNTLPEAIIIRTAWVFSQYGHNFVKTMLRLANEHSELRIVGDQLGCPTYAGDIAAVIICMIEQSAEAGIYHYCGDRAVTWAEFASEIFQQAESLNLLMNQPKVKPITTAEFPTPASRPAYSVMATQKIARYYPASNWRSALTAVLSSLA